MCCRPTTPVIATADECSITPIYETAKMDDSEFNETESKNPDEKGKVMDAKELKREKRRQYALERLGTNKPSCVICGETDWRCLERHHIGGRNFDEATAILCRNCHRKQTDDQKEHPKPGSSPPNLFDRAGHFLLGLADLLESLVRKCREYGHALIEHAKLINAQESEPQS
jgi:hypothetical protein